jgi:glycosyltransferase involved in cell wall biosynthesis
VARELADRMEIATFGSFAAFRNLALDRCRGDWVFFVDADERVSPALVQEIREVVAESEHLRALAPAQAPVGYWTPRHNLVCGRLVRGGGWSPDYQLRLLRRTQARYDEARPVHEVVKLDGPDARLTERLLHFNYETLGQFLAKQRAYTHLEAEGLRLSGTTFRWRALLGQPLREFFRRYLGLGGWRDGPLGLFLCGAMAYYAFRRVQLVRAAASSRSRLTAPGRAGGDR